MLRVPCAAVIIKNSDGDTLLNLREERPEIPFPNCWTLPGGRVEAGETAYQAAIRELFEETGLQLALTPWKIYERRYPDEDLVVAQHVFVGEIDGTNPQLALGEGKALEFFGRAAISYMPIAFGFETLLAEFLDAQ